MNNKIVIRAAVDGDVPAMAEIRAREWETHAYWEGRIGGYLQGTHSPQQALPERGAWVALQADRIIGFVAGHRTRRFECDGELEWLNVLPEFRGQGIAGQLTGVMLSWFLTQGMYRICVNVTSENAVARHVYAKQGAVPLSAGWMEWRDLRQSNLFEDGS